MEIEREEDVKITSYDNEMFVITRELANEFPWVKQMLEDIPTSDEAIPFRDASCDANTVSHIIQFQQRQLMLANDVKKEEEEAGDGFDGAISRANAHCLQEEANKEDWVFIESLSNEELDRVVCAANYLDLQHLLKLASLQIKKIFVASFERGFAGRNIEDMTKEECFDVVCALRREFYTEDAGFVKAWCTDEQREKMIQDWGHMVEAYRAAKASVSDDVDQ